MRVAVGAHLEDLAVELDHLAVESVEGAQPEIAVSLELAHRHVAGRCAFHQRIDSRGLKHSLVFVAEQALERLDDDGGEGLSGLFAPRAELARKRGREMDAKRQVLGHRASLSDGRDGWYCKRPNP